MKSIVRVFIQLDAAGVGSSHEYVVDDTHPGYGEVVAQAITSAVDSRPDPEGRLAELRRHIAVLGRQRPRSSMKPSGGKTPGARVQYFATSRLTGRQIRIELRHYDKPTGTGPNPDEPGN